MINFIATYKGNINPLIFGYNSFGTFEVKLPQGPAYDSYGMYLIVNVIDDSGGATVYEIPTVVNVYPNDQLADQIANSLFDTTQSSPFLLDINSGNLNLVSKNVISLTSVFNVQSLGASTGSPNAVSSTTADPNDDKKAFLREYLINKVADLTVSDISSIKVIGSALSVATGTIQQISKSSAVFF